MENEIGYALPLPEADARTAPFWDAAKRHEFMVQSCDDCGTLRFPPSANCPRCASELTTWKRVSGRGTIFSYIIVHQAMIPVFQECVPYNVVQVALDEDPKVIVTGNAVGVANEDIHVGMPVEALFDDVTADDTIVRWKLR